MSEPANLAERLAREIRRVTELRETYRQAGEMWAAATRPATNVQPAMLLMDEALERACVAAGGAGGVEAMVVAVRDLAGFTS